MYNDILLKEYFEIIGSPFYERELWNPEQEVLHKVTQFCIGLRLESSFSISFPCRHFATSICKTKTESGNNKHQAMYVD